MAKEKIIFDYILLEFSVVFITLTGIFLKLASKCVAFSFDFLLYYVLAFSVLAIYSFLWQVILEKFELYIAYGNRALGTIWAFVWSVVIFDDEVTLNMIIGAVFIILGVMILVKNDDK